MVLGTLCHGKHSVSSGLLQGSAMGQQVQMLPLSLHHPQVLCCALDVLLVLEEGALLAALLIK